METAEASDMQVAALERKQKLLALKNRYKPDSTQMEVSEDPDSPDRDPGEEMENTAKRLKCSNPEGQMDVGEKPHLVFRNYKPTDENLKELTAPEGRPERFDEQVTIRVYIMCFILMRIVRACLLQIDKIMFVF